MDRLEYQIKNFNPSDNDQEADFNFGVFKFIFMEGCFEVRFETWTNRGISIGVENGISILSVTRTGSGGGGTNEVKMPSIRLLPLVEQAILAVEELTTMI